MKQVLSIVIASLLLAGVAQAEEKLKMYFNNEELTKIIEIYSKASGQKFVVDPSVRGKVSMYIQEAVTVEEAFNQLSSALAINGFAISKQGDTMVIKSARNIQRDLVEVTTAKPTLKPERMTTWIYTVQNHSADSINRDLRMLTSKDGEMSVNMNTNQLIFTDWSSNLNRIAELMKEIDKPVDAKLAKMIETSKKERAEWKKERAHKKEEPKGETKAAKE